MVRFLFRVHRRIPAVAGHPRSGWPVGQSDFKHGQKSTRESPKVGVDLGCPHCVYVDSCRFL